MKESAQIALSFVRSPRQIWVEGVRRQGVHIHVPRRGAKDGPSAA